jgi:hypothetical protein
MPKLPWIVIWDFHGSNYEYCLLQCDVQLGQTNVSEDKSSLTFKLEGAGCELLDVGKFLCQLHSVTSENIFIIISLFLKQWLCHRTAVLCHKQNELLNLSWALICSLFVLWWMVVILLVVALGVVKFLVCWSFHTCLILFIINPCNIWHTVIWAVDCVIN